MLHFRPVIDRKSIMKHFRLTAKTKPEVQFNRQALNFSYENFDLTVKKIKLNHGFFIASTGVRVKFLAIKISIFDHKILQNLHVCVVFRIHAQI